MNPRVSLSGLDSVFLVHLPVHLADPVEQLLAVRDGAQSSRQLHTQLGVGARLTAAYPLGPLMEGAGMNITVVSYMDSVDFGIIACERSVPRVGDIALGFGAAVADLSKIALRETTEGLPVGGEAPTPRAAKARARFWAEGREGQREAAAHSRH